MGTVLTLATFTEGAIVAEAEGFGCGAGGTASTGLGAGGTASIGLAAST